MSTENSTDVESLKDIYTSVTDDGEGVITEEQEETPNKTIDQEAEEVQRTVSENIRNDGLDDAYEEDPRE